MAFIKETERKSLIHKINQSYAFRKFLIAIELLAIIGFIVVTFLSFIAINNQRVIPAWIEDGKLTGMGIGMLVWAIIIVVLGIIALIMTLSLKSPKTVKKEMDKLQSSALSGKKVKNSETSVEINKSRTEIKEKKTK